MKTQDQLVLDILSDGKERTGLEIIKGSGGKLHRGTIYIRLNIMEQLGRISRRVEIREGELPLHYFSRKTT